MRTLGATASLSPLRTRDALCALCIFLIALAIRLVFLARSPDAAWPHSATYEGDAIVWTVWAQALGRGEPFEFDLAFRTPAVAFLLHWLGLAAGPFFVAKVLWSTVGAATAALLYLTLARCAWRGAGVIAALFSAVSFSALTMATSLNNEVLYAFLLTALLFATLSWLDRPRVFTILVLGILHGLALLVRAEHLAVVALLALAMAVYSITATLDSRKLVALHGFVFVATIALVLTPWTLRAHHAAVKMNTTSPPIPYDSMWPEWSPSAIAAFEALPAYARSGNFAPFGKWVFQQQAREIDAALVERYFRETWGFTPEPLPTWPIVSMKGPLDFAIANHATADGGFAREALADRFDQNPTFSFARPSHARLATRGYAVGLAAIREHPDGWWRLAREKLRRFGDGVTLGVFATNWPYGAGGRREAVDMVVPARRAEPWWRFFLLTTMIVGCVTLSTRRLRPLALVVGIVLFSRLAIVLAFYGYARQAAAIGPVFDALTGIGIATLGACVVHLWPFELPAKLRTLGRVIAFCAAGILVVIAFRTAWNPPQYVARGADADSRVTRNEALGAGAFEGNGDILLEEIPRLVN
jgi:hypothetical protein